MAKAQFLLNISRKHVHSLSDLEYRHFQHLKGIRGNMVQFTIFFSTHPIGKGYMQRARQNIHFKGGGVEVLFISRGEAVHLNCESQILPRAGSLFTTVFS